MAIHTPIISPGFPEASASFRPTAVTLRFTAVMQDLSNYIEAERDLEHCDSRDPACDAWITDAERARRRVLDSLAILDAAPAQRRADLPLKRYGQLARLLITCNSPAQFQNIFALLARFPGLFRCQHSDRMARRVDLMIVAFGQHLHALAGLSDFADLIAAGDAALAADEAEFPIAAAA